MKTPQQKANELGNKFYRGNVFTHGKEQHLIELEFARQNAIIALEFAEENPLNTNGYKQYLAEVKQEIKLL